jgi:hypothetical protein
MTLARGSSLRAKSTLSGPLAIQVKYDCRMLSCPDVASWMCCKTATTNATPDATQARTPWMTRPRSRPGHRPFTRAPSAGPASKSHSESTISGAP